MEVPLFTIILFLKCFVFADVNECDQDDNVCDDEHGNCTNTHGSFNCACMYGFTGDGFRCTGAYGNQRPKLAVSLYITACSVHMQPRTRKKFLIKEVATLIMHI